MIHHTSSGLVFLRAHLHDPGNHDLTWLHILGPEYAITEATDHTVHVWPLSPCAYNTVPFTTLALYPMIVIAPWDAIPAEAERCGLARCQWGGGWTSIRIPSTLIVTTSIPALVRLLYHHPELAALESIVPQRPDETVEEYMDLLRVAALVRGGARTVEEFL